MKKNQGFGKNPKEEGKNQNRVLVNPVQPSNFTNVWNNQNPPSLQIRNPNMSTILSNYITGQNITNQQNQIVLRQDKFIGGYKVIQKLGTGLSSKVYLVEKEGVRYALKKFNIIPGMECETQDKIRYLFEREIEFLKLNNRNIIKYLSANKQESFLIIEYMKSINKQMELLKIIIWKILRKIMQCYLRK